MNAGYVRARPLTGRIVLLFAILAVLLAGCGGGSSGSPPPVQGINAETGKTIQSDDWMVTLLGQASKDKVVGDEEGEIQASISQYEQAVRTAQGVWIIVPIELKNQGDEANMLLSSTIMIADDQGREYPIGDRLVHHSQVWISDVTRWGDRKNQLVQNVFDAGIVREGPAIFDVREDATGLRLILKGSDESIDLGEFP